MRLASGAWTAGTQRGARSGPHWSDEDALDRNDGQWRGSQCSGNVGDPRAELDSHVLSLLYWEYMTFKLPESSL